MEYILAVLFSTNSILYSFHGLNLFWIFSGAILLFYIIGLKKDALLSVAKGSGGLLAFTVVTSILAVSFSWSETVKFVAGMFFNIVLMVYIVRDRYKWSMLRWAFAMSVLQGVETVVALFCRGSRLWNMQIMGDVHIEKLQLFYTEPAVLCFVSGLLFVYFVHHLLHNGVSLKLCLGSLICIADMYYSFSLGGILSAIVSLVVLIVANLILNRERLRKQRKNTILWICIFVVVLCGTIVVVLCSPVYQMRIQAMRDGIDKSYFYTVLDPYQKLVDSVQDTKGFGMGFGSGEKIANSFVGIAISCGILGVVAILIGIAVMVVYCIRFGGALDFALLCYIVLFQCTAGDFTNPVNYFVYGWIFADCIGKRNLLKEKDKKNDDTEHTRIVAIIGAKGLNNYGGYETFVDKLTEYHQNEQTIKYMIACKANGSGAMDETKLENAESIGKNEFVYHNAHCFKIRVPQIGSGQAIIYDLLAARHVINYFRKHKVEQPILYILTCRIGPFIKWIANEMHDIGGEYYLNPDGHEFLRACWSPKVRQYWKYSEKLMVKYADKIICDSKNIETYIQASYEQYKPNTTYIAYGCDLEPSELKDDNKLYVAWMQMHELEPQEYYLVVGRFVPENNYETMIREFMETSTKKNFVIITNTNTTFLEELEEKLHFSNDSRIKFVGTVYEKELLKKIRENAYAYLHGHEVGGTNPSLLEALGYTKLNLLLDVGFNRECGEQAALYWRKEEGSLAKLIDECDTMDNCEINVYGDKAKKRIKDAYSWQFIADEYARIFVKVESR